MQPRSVVAGSGVDGYSEAFHRGKREVLAVKIAGTHQGVNTALQLVDPTDGSVVVQPYESRRRPGAESTAYVVAGRGTRLLASWLLENTGSKSRASAMTGSGGAAIVALRQDSVGWEVLSRWRRSRRCASCMHLDVASCLPQPRSRPKAPAAVAVDDRAISISAVCMMPSVLRPLQYAC